MNLSKDELKTLLRIYQEHNPDGVALQRSFKGDLTVHFTTEGGADLTALVARRGGGCSVFHRPVLRFNNFLHNGGAPCTTE